MTQTPQDKERAKRVYISGRISGLPLDEAKKKFQHYEDFIRSIGLTPINPMHNGLPDTASWMQHMHEDIDLVASAGAILFIPDWTKSDGANVEYFVARHLGLEIHTLTQTLEEYARRVLSAPKQ